MTKSMQHTDAHELNPNRIREHILRLCFASSEGHIASSMSIVDLLVSVYSVNKLKTKSDRFDNIILSKGHAVYALYGLMLELGIYDSFFENGVCENGSFLIGHVPQIRELGLNVGTGSLGHGFPYAVGRAFSKVDGSDRIHVIVGDGELNEGSIWETLNLLEKFPELPINLYIDDNRSSDRAIPLDAARRALKCGYNAKIINGHDIQDMKDQILNSYNSKGYKIYLCETIKGYPLRKMIGNPSWHHRVPNETELNEFLRELK